MTLLVHIIIVAGWIVVMTVIVYAYRRGFGGSEFDEMERRQEGLAALGNRQAGIPFSATIFDKDDRIVGFIEPWIEDIRPFDWEKDDYSLSVKPGYIWHNWASGTRFIFDGKNWTPVQ